jgi:integrase
MRDLALFNLAIDSKLRGCDLVALHVDDVAPNGYAIDRANVRQRKTGRPVRFELTDPTRQSLDDYLRISGRKPGQCLFPGRRGPERSLTTRQYARLVSQWIVSIGLDPLKFATHSMRRTKATLIYRRTGNLRANQLLLSHTKIESTVRYHGVEVGTGGNGCASRKLYRRTNDLMWLERARSFAMTVISQYREARDQLGRGRYSLWTDDIGLAVYLWDCLTAEPRFPTIDVF